MLLGMVRRIATSVPAMRRFRAGEILFRRPVLGGTRMLCTRDLCGSEYRDQFLHALDHDGWWRVFESLRARQFLASILAHTPLSTAHEIRQIARDESQVPARAVRGVRCPRFELRGVMCPRFVESGARELGLPSRWLEPGNVLTRRQIASSLAAYSAGVIGRIRHPTRLAATAWAMHLGEATIE